MNTKQQKKTTTTGLTLKHTLATVGLMLGFAWAAPAAAVQCGDVIGPNVTVALHGTLTCDDATTAALTIVGPADVDLSDLDIACNDANQNGYVSLGLIIGGQGAKVYDGVVNGCYHGVLVWGQGQHLIKRMTTIFSHALGFYVASSGNTLTQNRAADSGFFIGTDTNKLSENVAEYCHWGAGFQIEGNKNQLDRNVARYGGWFGFSIYGGEGNRLTANMVTDNEWGGFEIKANKTTLRQNQALRNDYTGFEIEGHKNQLDGNVVRYITGNGDGFALYGGDDNRLTANVVTDTESTGFWLLGNRTTLRRNQALRNDDGFILYGNDLSVTKNQAHDSRESGILLSAGSNNVVLTNNVALNNNTENNAEDFDLRDGAINCGTHTWQNNTFGTANKPCIQ